MNQKTLLHTLFCLFLKSSKVLSVSLSSINKTVQTCSSQSYFSFDIWLWMILLHDKSSRSRMFFKISVFKHFPIFIEKQLCWSLFLMKLQEICSFIKGTLQKRCFPGNIAKLLRTPFFKEHIQWLVLT